MRIKPLSATAEMLKAKHEAVAAEVRTLEAQFEQRAEQYFSEEQRQKLELLRGDAGRLLKAFETEQSLNASASV